MVKECCDYCIDSEGFDVELEDGVCPVCGDKYNEVIEDE